MLKKENYIILTGGPGSGKTAVINRLKSLGHLTVSETAREIIKKETEAVGQATHTQDHVSFSKLMLEAGIKDYMKFTKNTAPIFFDRGIVDLHGYQMMMQRKVTQQVSNAIAHYRYNKIVFIFPPWPEIYRTDKQRKQSYSEAVNTFEHLKQGYLEHDYQLIEVPKASIALRVSFITQQILLY